MASNLDTIHEICDSVNYTNDINDETKKKIITDL